MKRFSDTQRFAEAWYADLSASHKLAWEYVWANCDNAGVWAVNKRLADFQIGSKVDWPGLLKACGERLVELSDDRWFLPGFVSFQCGVLNPESRPHGHVIGLLRKHGLLIGDSLSIVYPRGIYTPKDKDKEKDTDQEQDRGGMGEITHDAPAPQRNRARGTFNEIVEFCLEIGLTEKDGEACFYKWEGNGWTNNGKPVKDWRSTIRAWKAISIHPSQKNGGTSEPHLRDRTHEVGLGETDTERMKRAWDEALANAGGTL